MTRNQDAQPAHPADMREPHDAGWDTPTIAGRPDIDADSPMTTSTHTRVTLEILEGPDQTSDDSGWVHFAYKVLLRYDGRQMMTPWMQGVGITRDPSARDILESLFLDAAGYDNARGFEDWAADYDYDTDSRKAEATYRACGKVARRLARLFNVADHDLAPWMTDDAETLARRYADGD